MHPTDAAVLLAIVMMVGASVDDLRRRRVDNRWWLPFLGAAVVMDVLLLVDVGLRGPEAILLAISAGSCALFYLMWRYRMFGGADAKGLMVLALLLPLPVVQPALVPALDALSNGLLVAMVLPVGFAIWNLAHGHVAGPATFLGFRAPLEAARQWMVWPMQRIEDGTAVIRVRTQLQPVSDDDWDALADAGITLPWVTPKVPFFVPLTVGALLAIWLGNLLLRVMEWALG